MLLNGEYNHLYFPNVRHTYFVGGYSYNKDHPPAQIPNGERWG
jgi:hypothetical protein